MAWKTLAAALESAIAQGLECDTGKGVGALEPGGKVARPKPGQVNREVTLPTHTKDASRYGRMDGFPQPGGRAPVHSMRQYLIVIEGGRQTHSNLIPNGPADQDALAGDDARHVLLKLVAN
jgi:hypothetical protein